MQSGHRLTITRSVAVERTARVIQLEGLFDVPLADRSTLRWEVEMPLHERPWQIGLIYGPSGCGKSTIAKEIWGQRVCGGFAWSETQSVVDGFPAAMSMQDITGLLSSVGFSSPPSWVRPFGVLSNGEQFRATMARAIAEAEGVFAIDEFTSVVDRRVAKIGSAAIAKAVRRRPGCQFVAIACHDDIVEWLCPDWTYEPAAGKFAWRSLRRPGIEVDIRRAKIAEWRLFRPHHYLSGAHHAGAYAFVGLVAGSPAVWSAWLYFPGKTNWGYREHRTVCLPDYQGVGIGNAMSDWCAGVMQAVAGRGVIRSTTSAPGMIAHRSRSSLWRRNRQTLNESTEHGGMKIKTAYGRLVTGFLYRGPARTAEARALGLRIGLGA